MLNLLKYISVFVPIWYSGGNSWPKKKKKKLGDVNREAIVNYNDTS